jgi:hypothetical protein
VTIEGRPFLGPDQTYEKQRQCRMQDAIDDYLNDEKVSSRQAYEEMLSCIDDVVKYHEQAYCRAVGLRDLMMGHREVDLDDLAKKWQYDKLPERY